MAPERDRSAFLSQEERPTANYQDNGILDDLMLKKSGHRKRIPLESCLEKYTMVKRKHLPQWNSPKYLFELPKENVIKATSREWKETIFKN